MAAEIVKIEPDDPTKAVVAKLEEVLADAREGRYSAVAIALVLRDGNLSARWSPSPLFGQLLGAVNRLAFKLNASQS